MFYTYLYYLIFIIQLKVQRNGNYPLISSYESELVNVFYFENTLEQQSQNIPIIQDSIVENEDNYIIESDDEQQTYETDLTYLQGILNKLYTIQILGYRSFRRRPFRRHPFRRRRFAESHLAEKTFRRIPFPRQAISPTDPFPRHTVLLKMVVFSFAFFCFICLFNFVFFALFHLIMFIY